MTPKNRKILSEMSHIQNMFIMQGHDIDWLWFKSSDGKFIYRHPEVEMAGELNEDNKN